MAVDRDTEERWAAVDAADPDTIDGTPEQVEAVVLAQLPATIDAFAEFIDSVGRQLANAERQRILLTDVSMSAEDLAAKYLESDRAAALARLSGSAKALCSVASEITEKS